MHMSRHSMASAFFKSLLVLILVSGAVSSAATDHSLNATQSPTALDMGNVKNASLAMSNLNSSVPKRAGNLTAVKLAQLRSFDEYAAAEDTTAVPLGANIVKFALIGLLVFVPLALLPILFLFTRSGAKIDSGAPEELQTLLEHVTLLPTLPGQDPYLLDSTVWGPDDAPVVAADERSGQPVYQLRPGVTLYRPTTRQLYHPPSGLLFNPVLYHSFDPATGQVIRSYDNVRLPANSNFVYKPGSNWLFERCLSLSLVASADQDGVEWRLARSPVALAHQSPSIKPIRRVRVEELPAIFEQPYSKLLAEWKQSRMARAGTFQPPNASEFNGDEDMLWESPQELVTTLADPQPTPSIYEDTRSQVVLL